MKKNLKSILILVTLCIYLALCFFHSDLVRENFLEYSLLLLTKLFPVSFIMFLFSSLLIRYQLLEVCSSLLSIHTHKFYVFLLSSLSGFPSGAKCVKELFEQKSISLEEANHILMFSHFPNPLFVLGSVSSLVRSPKLCIGILCSIGISNFILMIGKPSKKEKVLEKEISFPNNFSHVLTESIFSSMHTLIIIYGVSMFFYLFSSMITKHISLSTPFFILWNGCFDLTKGIFSTSLIQNSLHRAYWILGFLSFGSLSIHMQVKSILAETPVSYWSFLKGRIIGTILSFFLFSFLH